MNTKAYFAGKLAASEKYLLAGHLLDMSAQEAIARQERDRCSYDFEIWYWQGQIDYIKQFQEDKHHFGGVRTSVHRVNRLSTLL